MTTEQAEPLLLLPDYLAGIAHSALTPDPGRLPFPVEHPLANELLENLKGSGKLWLLEMPFNFSYEQIFGADLMAAARENAR